MLESARERRVQIGNAPRASHVFGFLVSPISFLIQSPGIVFSLEEIVGSLNFFLAAVQLNQRYLKSKNKFKKLQTLSCFVWRLLVKCKILPTDIFVLNGSAFFYLLRCVVKLRK